ncbi:tetratricopeptide repeat protein [Phormidium nigroviride]
MVHYQEVKLQELSEVEVFHLRYNAAGKLVLPVSVTSNEFLETSVTENEELSAGVRELTDKEISHIRWAFYYLKIYEPQPTADNLEKVNHYLEAFNHFCELAAWEEAWQVLFIRCDTPTREELHNQLQTWGYYRLQIELYNQLLGKLENKYRDSICYCGLGIAYRNLGDYRLAIEYHQKDLEIAREIGDRGGEGGANGNLGNAYQSLGDYRLAIEYHQKRLEIAIEVGDRGGEGRANGGLGNAYQSLGDYRLAIEYHEKWLEIAIEVGDRGGEGQTYGGLGNAYYSLGDYRLGIDYYQKQLEIVREIGDRRGEANAWFNLGNTLARVDRKLEAITAYENARNLFEVMGLDKDVEDCDNSIRDIGMKVVVEPQRYLELPGTPARRKGRKFSRKWQQLKADIGNSFSIFFRWVSRWVRSVFRK